jgi:hypothetical protein
MPDVFVNLLFLPEGITAGDVVYKTTQVYLESVSGETAYVAPRPTLVLCASFDWKNV